LKFAIILYWFLHKYSIATIFLAVNILKLGKSSSILFGRQLMAIPTISWIIINNSTYFFIQLFMNKGWLFIWLCQMNCFNLLRRIRCFPCKNILQFQRPIANSTSQGLLTAFMLHNYILNGWMLDLQSKIINFLSIWSMLILLKMMLGYFMYETILTCDVLFLGWFSIIDSWSWVGECSVFMLERMVGVDVIENAYAVCSFDVVVFEWFFAICAIILHWFIFRYKWLHR